MPNQEINGIVRKPQQKSIDSNCSKLDSTLENIVNMSSKEDSKSRDDVLAAREAKKLAKQKGKPKPTQSEAQPQPTVTKSDTPKENSATEKIGKENKETKKQATSESAKSKDEVDKAVVKTDDISKDDIKAERAAKKAAKQAKKKKEDGGDACADNMTVKDVVETLKDIANVAREVQDVTAKVQAINLEPKKVIFILFYLLRKSTLVKCICLARILINLLFLLILTVNVFF